MKSQEELRRAAADHPERLVEYIAALQEQLRQTGQALTAAQRDLAQTKGLLRQQAEQLAQAPALIAEQKRELFGAKADTLHAEQEQQLSRNHAVATTKYTKYTKGNGSRAGG